MSRVVPALLAGFELLATDAFTAGANPVLINRPYPPRRQRWHNGATPHEGRAKSYTAGNAPDLTKNRLKIAEISGQKETLRHWRTTSSTTGRS